MSKHLSYSGITIPLASPNLIRIVENLKPWDAFTEADYWNFDQPGFYTNRLPTPQLPKPPQFRIGTLVWPTGASEPAWFHAVVETSRLVNIRTVVSDPMTPQPLVMNDGRVGGEITASMYMLPPRPLNQLGLATSDSWLLTLTDQRFWWYWRRASITTKPSTWSSLFSTLGSALGVSIAVETVDSRYGTPSTRWIGRNVPTPVTLDAAATAVGQRVVVALNGNVSTTTWETAQTASNAQLVDARALIGGFVDTGDIGRYVPASVNTLFLNSTNPPNVTTPFTINKTLVTLAITDYGSQTGLTGFSQIIYADLVYTGANATAADNYATVASTDWYGWKLSDVDVSLPGIFLWSPTGWEDCVEWTIDLRDQTAWEVEADASGDGIPDPFSSTVIRRGPWTDFTSGYFPPGNGSGGGDGGDVGGCGWIAGMSCDWCFEARVITAGGECADIDDLNPNPFTLRGELSEGTCTWTSQTWNCDTDMWETANFTTDAGSGPITVILDTSVPIIRMTVAGCTLVLNSCGEYNAVFSGGNTACPGVCTSPLPDPCEPNTFQVFLECTCCPIDGWQGEGYYCVDMSGTPTPVLLTEEDRCDTGITILSCRFDTFEEAEEACNPVVPDAECNGSPITVSQALYIHFTAATGDCSALVGQTIGPMIWNGAGAWVNTGTQLGFTTFRVDLNPGPPWEICSTGVTLAGCVNDTTGLSCVQCSPFLLQNGGIPCNGDCGATGTISYDVNESPT